MCGSRLVEAPSSPAMCPLCLCACITCVMALRSMTLTDERRDRSIDESRLISLALLVFARQVSIRCRRDSWTRCVSETEGGERERGDDIGVRGHKDERMRQFAETERGGGGSFRTKQTSRMGNEKQGTGRSRSEERAGAGGGGREGRERVRGHTEHHRMTCALSWNDR